MTQELTWLSLAFANPLLFTDRKDAVLTLGGMREAGCGRSWCSPPAMGTFLGEQGSLAALGGCGRGAAPAALRALRAAHGSQAQGAVGEKAQETSG